MYVSILCVSMYNMYFTKPGNTYPQKDTNNIFLETFQIPYLIFFPRIIL